MDIDTPPPHQSTTADLPPSSSPPPPPTAISDIRTSDPTNNGDRNEVMMDLPTNIAMDGNADGATPRIGRRLRNSLGSGSAGPSRASTPAGGSVNASGGRSTRRNRYVFMFFVTSQSSPSTLMSGSEVVLWHPLSHTLLCCVASLATHCGTTLILVRPSMIKPNGDANGHEQGPNGTSSALPANATDIAPSGALSIFAPPLSTDLPEALQDVISPSKARATTNGNGHGHSNGDISAGPSTNTSSRELRVRLTIPNTGTTTTTTTGGATTAIDGELVKEASDGLASRLRPTRGRESTQRTGVSASGKGVKVGGGARTATGPSTSVTRKKGALPSEIVRPLSVFDTRLKTFADLYSQTRISARYAGESVDSCVVMAVPVLSTSCA